VDLEQSVVRLERHTVSSIAQGNSFISIHGYFLGEYFVRYKGIPIVCVEETFDISWRESIAFVILYVGPSHLVWA